MAKPSRKPAKGKPITQHQLFPAVVALWFGALFGLGSLAIRPSLIEDLVIKSRIDLLIPVAAPPLGMTARMLIALVMAALGAMIGAWLARRIARPKREVRERKRTNLSTRDEGADGGSFNTYGDASTRNPGPVSDDASAPGVIAGRRRSLTIEHEHSDFVPHELAPLPGGAPQIFNIAAAGLDDSPALPTAAELGSHFAAVPQPTSPPVALDWTNTAPLDEPAAPIAPAELAQAPVVQPQMFAPAEPVAEPAVTDDRQVFGMAPPATAPADLPRQFFGAPVTDDHVPKEFIEAHGFRSSVFAAPEPSPLFSVRADVAPFEHEPLAPDVAFPPPEEAPIPAAVAVQSEPAPALPSPTTLGIEDLSARLAESMRRRRAGRTAAATAAEPALVAAAEEPEFVELKAMPSPVPEFSVPQFTVPSYTVPEAAEWVAPSASLPQAPDPIPAALRPLDLGGFEEHDHPAQDSLLPPRRIVFPVEAAPAPELPAAIVPPPADNAEAEPELAEEVALAEQDYASLLGVTPSPVILRNPFVRVEEREAEAETIEPVVIFPGQAVPAPQPVAVASAAAGEQVTPFRRFDSPSSAGQGQLSAATHAANAMPSEEAEQALRSALANLQRMSGAA